MTNDTDDNNNDLEEPLLPPPPPPPLSVALISSNDQDPTWSSVSGAHSNHEHRQDGEWTFRQGNNNNGNGDENSITTEQRHGGTISSTGIGNSILYRIWNTPLFPDDWNQVLQWLGWQPSVEDEEHPEEGSRGSSSSSSSSFAHQYHHRHQHHNQYTCFLVRLLKFMGLTWGAIALVHFLVTKYTNDRDARLTIQQLWLYEGDQISRDVMVFFVVGRIWQQPCGVDNLLWITMMALANVYFESQAFLPWLQHSVTLYEIHCIWPWQLWVFAITLVPVFATILGAHVVVAYQQVILGSKLLELGLFLGLFLWPVMFSPYFHFHHWFAGWLLGMHANLPNVWWSRATMAYFWGMYVNGIAVYGRDPLLTCDYARFVVQDLACQLTAAGLEGVKLDGLDDERPVGDGDVTKIMTWPFLFGEVLQATRYEDKLHPSDWKNCSSEGYHP